MALKESCILDSNKKAVALMKNEIPEPIFLSAPKAATLCGVSRNTICCWIRDGKLPSYRTAGGKYLIRPIDLIGFMRENSMFVSQPLVDLSVEDEKANEASDPAVAEQERNTSVEPSILVVDDDADARLLAVRILEPLGAPIIEAEDGYDALHKLTKHPEIGVIILDLVMPGQDGVKTYSEIREKNISVPVIIVTGKSPEEVKGSFGENEPDLIITKPYQPAHLLSVAGAYLSDLGI